MSKITRIISMIKSLQLNNMGDIKKRFNRFSYSLPPYDSKLQLMQNRDEIIIRSKIIYNLLIMILHVKLQQLDMILSRNK